jgi:hypothetical protein
MAALKSEYRKLFSTRMWWVIMICAAVYMAFIGALMSLSFQFMVNELDQALGAMPDDQLYDDTGFIPRGAELARTVYSTAGSFAYVFPLLIGALAITQEYRHKTITQTFLAEPRRQVVLGSKLVAALPMGLAYGAACLAATALPAVIVISLLGGDPGLGELETWAFFGRALLDFALWASVGVGLGSLVTNQVALIVVVLADTQFVEPLLRMGGQMMGQDWGWTKFLPGAAGDSIQGFSFYTMMGGQVELLGWGWGALVLAGWAALFAGAGYLFRFRGDVS